MSWMEDFIPSSLTVSKVGSVAIAKVEDLFDRAEDLFDRADLFETLDRAEVLSSSLRLLREPDDLRLALASSP